MLHKKKKIRLIFKILIDFRRFFFIIKLFQSYERERERERDGFDHKCSFYCSRDKISQFETKQNQNIFIKDDKLNLTLIYIYICYNS